MPSSSTEKPTSSKIRRGRKRAYVGEIHTSDFSSPEKRKRNMNIIRKRVQIQNKKIRILQQSVRRMKHNITSMKTLLDYLREKSLISESAEVTISASVNPGAASDLFQRKLKGKRSQKYNPTLRAFALTLAFYSPKGYNFVRKTFNNSLPHLETISKWYRSVDGSPGFTNEALTALSLRQKEVSYPLLCNLVMDEMSIRRQVEWTGSKFTGYVDVGTNLDSDILPEAREAC
ncbi:uncharacterized protein LOC123310364 [Coccinella septempunctata]|uniref:uncharacterized protein LOC123310364 n=1 Tax=Coccinella septempunctata TaxID=41139 RepID=UPI001D074E33|nr:uncharacterized protein LOC123310364 [Coccinella septempunctata]